MAVRATALFLLLSVLIPHSLFSDTPAPQFNVNNVFSDRDFLLVEPDRTEGSSGEARAFSLITETLEREHIPFEILPLEDLGTFSTRSRIIEAWVQGLSEQELVLAVPVNNAEDSAKGGYYNIPLALEVLRMYRKRPGRLGLRVLFLGGEKRNPGGEPPLGSSHYVEVLREERSALVLYLDFEELPERIYMDTGTSRPVTPLWLLRDVSGQLNRAGLLPDLDTGRVSLARTGLSDTISPLTPWLADEIPAIRLTGRGVGLLRPWEQRIAISRLGQFFASIGDLYDQGIPEDSDVNYAVFQFAGGDPLFIPEGNLVLGFFLLLAFVALLSLTQERKLLYNLRRDYPYLWSAPLFLFLVFLFLFLSTLILELVCLVRDFPTLWVSAPRIFFLFKLSLTAVLSLSFLHLAGGLPLSRSPHFYSYAAIASTLLNLLILSSLHVSLSLFYLWPLLLLILFQLIRRVWVKTLLASLMPLLIIPILFRVFSEDNTAFTRLLIMSRKGGNLILALGILPFLFVVSSLNNHSFYYTGSRRKSGVFVSILTSGLASAVFLVLILFHLDPWRERPQPVVLERRVDLTDGTQVLRLESPSPLPETELLIPGSGSRVLSRAGRKEVLALPYDGPGLDLEKEKIRFLGRERYLLRIKTPGRIRECRLRLNSKEPLKINYCNYPVEVSPDGSSAVIFTERNPPAPFFLEITLVAGSRARLEAEFLLDQDPEPVVINGPNLETEQKFFLRTEIPLGFELPSP